MNTENKIRIARRGKKANMPHGVPTFTRDLASIEKNNMLITRI